MSGEANILAVTQHLRGQALEARLDGAQFSASTDRESGGTLSPRRSFPAVKPKPLSPVAWQTVTARWSELLAPEVHHSAHIAKELGLPPLPSLQSKKSFQNIESESPAITSGQTLSALPPLPWFALQKTSASYNELMSDFVRDAMRASGERGETNLELPPLPVQAATAAQGTLLGTQIDSGAKVATSVAEIVARASAGKRVSAAIQPEFRKKSDVKTTPKKDSDFLAMLPADVKPLAAVLHETLSMFPDEELDELLLGWDWKSRLLVQKLSK